MIKELILENFTKNENLWYTNFISKNIHDEKIFGDLKVSIITQNLRLLSIRKG